MAARSTTSQFQPAPPANRLNRGKFLGVLAIKTTASNPGVKSNMCVAPATNGSREKGLAPSQPASAKKGMSVRPSLNT